MKSKQIKIENEAQWAKAKNAMLELNPNLVMIFGGTSHFEKTDLVAKISKDFKSVLIIGCSTAGEISNDGVSEESLIVTACALNNADFRPVWSDFSDMDHTIDGGRSLGAKLATKDLKAIFLLGRGLDINGSALINGIKEKVGKEVIITGGLAGDGGRFQKTYTVLNGEISSSRVVGFGIYGDQIEVSFGSVGGWEAFGPVRQITKSDRNVLYELDGQPALEIYKKYLGEKAKDLPASGLLFPFALLKDSKDANGLIRTILAVDEKAKSLTFAGDIPNNGLVRLMHTNNSGLVEGARAAAKLSVNSKQPEDHTGLGILISCVGRKLVMGLEIEDELDAVKETFGEQTIAGFYSYGEICPDGKFSECKLHNQTMTITYFSEKKRAA